jgi:arginine deiminase
LSNLIFIRDQQIVTAKGLVLGNTGTSVRRFERIVMKSGGTKIKHLDQYIEGGDFMMMSKDLSLIQIGTRSNIQGAKFLMDNDLLGTRRFGVVKDEHDRDQQRMHLDTIVNLIDDRNVIMLDFDDPALPKGVRRDVDIYEQVQETGKYELKETLEFEKFLTREGYRIIKASNKQQ